MRAVRTPLSPHALSLSHTHTHTHTSNLLLRNSSLQVHACTPCMRSDAPPPPCAECGSAHCGSGSSDVDAVVVVIPRHGVKTSLAPLPSSLLPILPHDDKAQHMTARHDTARHGTAPHREASAETCEKGMAKAQQPFRIKIEEEEEALPPFQARERDPYQGGSARPPLLWLGGVEHTHRKRYGLGPASSGVSLFHTHTDTQTHRHTPCPHPGRTGRSLALCPSETRYSRADCQTHTEL